MDSIMIFVWLGLVALALFCEAMTTSLVAIWFVPAALASLLLSFFQIEVWLQVVVFFALSILMILLFQLVFKKKLRAKQSAMRTNTDRLLGERAVVTEEIDNLMATGAVKISGQEWSARSCDERKIAVGTVVEILSISGVKLICKPIG